MKYPDNHKAGEDFQIDVKAYFEKAFGGTYNLEEEIPIGVTYNLKKGHKFDLVNSKKKIAVECKRYTWTETGNVPSAKLGAINEAVFYLSILPAEYEKYVVLFKASNPQKKETLAEYYYRTNIHLLGDVKVAEYEPSSKSFKVLGSGVKDACNVLVSDYDIKITREWFRRGRMESDPVFKFVSYWLAFIQLFNYGLSKFDLEQEGESTRIIDYCKDKTDILYDLIDFDADYLKVFRDRPVVKGTEKTGRIDVQQNRAEIEELIKKQLDKTNDKTNSSDDIQKIAKDYKTLCNPKASNKDKVKALFCSIYRVRCNLFHGSKRPDPGRDLELIKSSCEILEICIPRLIDCTYGAR